MSPNSSSRAWLHPVGLPRLLALLAAPLPVACAVDAVAQPKPPPLGAAAPPGLGGKPPSLGPYGGGGGAPAPSAAPPGLPPEATLGAKPPPLPPGAGPFGNGGGRISSGTGFVVAPGRVLTNHHVAEGCAEMRARLPGGTELSASVAATDAGRDLALLTVRGDAGPALAFRSGPDVRRGEAVVTYGFPLAGLLSSGPTLTTGDVSALAGMRDNQAQYQISAPVQPGNSGGPLLDLGGNVVGVVVSKLNAQRVAARTGDIPQNVNFAVKAAEAIDFLRRNGVQPRQAQTGLPARNAAEVGEVAHPSTLFLRCVR